MNKFIHERGSLKIVKDSFGKEQKYLSVWNPESLKVNQQYFALLFSPTDRDNHNLELNHAVLEFASHNFMSRSNSISEYKGVITDEGLHIKEVEFLRTVGEFLGYLNNCHSFRNHLGNFEEFDKFELNNRLDKIKKLLQ